MKRLLLIVSPYFIFCLLFSFLFLFRPTKNNENLKNTNDSNNKPIIVDSLSNLESDTIF